MCILYMCVFRAAVVSIIRPLFPWSLSLDEVLSETGFYSVDSAIYIYYISGVFIFFIGYSCSELVTLVFTLSFIFFFSAGYSCPVLVISVLFTY